MSANEKGHVPPKSSVNQNVHSRCSDAIHLFRYRVMPEDPEGYKYFVLIGDIFSKFIQAVPLREQTAAQISQGLLNHWIYVHGKPSYLLTDQGSNVDGEIIREICNSLGIEKRRTSAYHSQGNGFAERNIQSIREILRTREEDLSNYVEKSFTWTSLCVKF